MIDEQKLDKLKQQYLYEILSAIDLRSSSALYAYANFLNREPLDYRHFPLYLKIFEANNSYAVDALAGEYVPEKFLDFAVVPNHFVIKSLFETLNRHQSNTLCEKTVRINLWFPVENV